MNIQAYARITDRIIALLEQGTVPWHKPWKVKTGPPRNLVTGKPYRGINVFLLMALGYDSPHWLTFRQAIQLGGSVKKGEKACPVVFWKRMTIEDEATEDKRKIPLLRLYHVFNIAQCEGLGTRSATEDPPIVPAKPAEVAANMPQPPALKHGMAKAFYSLSDDIVWMPPRSRFENEDGYFATLFHELVHSSGHEKRLKRQSLLEKGGFGTDPYCREELVAEMGAAFLCGHAEIVDRTIDNSAAYIAGWLKQLKDDKTLIVQAAAQAQKAADFILGAFPDEREADAGEAANSKQIEVAA